MCATTRFIAAGSLGIMLVAGAGLALSRSADADSTMLHPVDPSGEKAAVIVAAEPHVTDHAHHPWVTRSRLVQIDLAALRSAPRKSPTDRRLSFALFDDLTIAVDIRRAEVHDRDRSTYTGVVPRAIGSHATISVHHDVVYGVIGVPGVGTFEIRPAGEGLHRVRQIDVSAMPKRGGGIEPPIEALDGVEHLPGFDGDIEMGGPVVVDVLVVYTPAAVDLAGDFFALSAMINTAIAQTNTALANSQTIVQLQLAGTQLVDYEESGSIIADLFFAAFESSAIATARADVCADLVVMLVAYEPDDENDEVPCDAAFTMTAPGPGFVNSAFSVTNVECMSDFTFTHAIGHNMGCGHAHDEFGSGSYPYSRAHRFTGDSATLWRTVMAHGDGEQILNFSNPFVSHDGVPTGVLPGLPGEAHNALTIDNNAHIVANFGNQICGETYYVPDDFSTIQAAINVALNGDEIVVAPGTYHETIDLLGKAIRLRSSDGPNVTIIDGQSSGSVITCQNGEGTGTLIDGFTVTGGSALLGGGMYIENSSPIVVNCIFEGNSADSRGGAIANVAASPTIANCTFTNNTAVWGGAMSNTNGSTPNISLSTFNDNSATLFGGAVYNKDSSPDITNSTFQGNAANRGGGIFNTNSHPDVLICIFQDNTADKGAAICNEDNSHASVQASTIVDNTAQTDGGGAYSHPGSVSTFIMSTVCDNTPNNIAGPFEDVDGNTICADPVLVPDQYPTIQDAINAAIGGEVILVSPGTYEETIDFLGKNIHLLSAEGPEVTVIDGMAEGSVVTFAGGEGSDSLIEGFTITGGSATRGGGIRILNSGPKVLDCIIEGNTASVSGGGIHNENSDPSVNDCIVRSNTAGWGAGMYNQNSDPVLTNCHFESNTAANSGGGLENTVGSHPTLISCTFLANTAGSTGGAMTNAGSSNPKVVSCTFRNNAATQGGGAVWNFDNSPPLIGNSLFCANSPDHMVGPWDDLGGNQFLSECPDECPPVDLNCDGVVNVQDLLILIGAWGACANCNDCPADLTGDCTVGVADLLILLSNWG